MRITKSIRRIASDGATNISELSKLSSEQLDVIERQKQHYLTEMPDPNDTAAQELTNRLLSACGIEI